MSSLRPLVLLLLPLAPIAALAAVAPACSSSTAATPDAGPSDDAAVGDAPIGPLFCALPVPATCPQTAPCTFTAWGCPASACEGYFVVTDGTWIYYYSSIGGALAGEVLAADTAFVACPYAFQPPAGCTPAIASECVIDGGTSDGSPGDGASAPDGSASSDSAADGASTSDGGLTAEGGADSGAADGADGADGS